MDEAMGDLPSTPACTGRTLMRDTDARGKHQARDEGPGDLPRFLFLEKQQGVSIDTKNPAFKQQVGHSVAMHPAYRLLKSKAGVL